MGCGLCHRDERCADKNKDYLCSTCVVKMISMDRDQKRVFIDSLYLKEQDEEAEFLERFFRGGVTIPIKEEEGSASEEPVLLKRRTRSL